MNEKSEQLKTVVKEGRYLLCPYRKLLKCLDKNGKDVSFNDVNVFIRLERFCECLGIVCARYDKQTQNCKGY